MPHERLREGGDEGGDEGARDGERLREAVRCCERARRASSVQAGVGDVM